jgi:oxygen-independent coproporphyrinogen-3 oxidase
VYRDRLWQGADLAGLGVASFGHINGVHMQNLDTWETYSARIREGALPLSRAYRPDAEERLIREFVLQLKLGRLRPSYFAEKHGVDVLRRFQEPLRSLGEDGFLAEATSDRISLTRAGLLRVDSLLPRFFQPQHAGIRYT